MNPKLFAMHNSGAEISRRLPWRHFVSGSDVMLFAASCGAKIAARQVVKHVRNDELSASRASK
jgi:hypothetical protein